MRVLVAEDDADVREAVVVRLRREGFAVDEASTLDEAERAIVEHDHGCLVLDRMLPDGDSLGLVERWRYDGNNVPVLFLTALASPGDRVEGLGFGDDYLVKPFGLDELVARVRALCRRGTRPLPVVERRGDIEMNRATREVWRGGVLCSLTPKEFAILAVLVDAGGAMVSTSELIECCWDDEADMFSKAVYVHLASLRRKLGEPAVIRSVRGEGYALRVGTDTRTDP